MTTEQDKLEILTLMREYNRAIDAGEDAQWAATYIQDGVFRHPARTWQGTDELRTFCASRTAGLDKAPLTDMRHWNDAIDITVSGDEATVTCDLAVIGNSRETGKPTLAATGSYRDRLVRRDGAWRFVERALVLS